MSKYLFTIIFFFGSGFFNNVFSQKFTVLKPEETGIYFRCNPDMTTVPFEGSGVGVADFDNDGLTDIFFAGTPESKLYKNKGNLQFEDITTSSQIKTGNGATSVAIADLNNDGWNDILVGKSKRFNNDTTQNVLIYINQKNGKFKELGLQLGVNSNLHDISRINVFDINNDGHLDIVIHHWDGFDVSDYGALLGGNVQDYSGYYDKVFIYEKGVYKDQTQQYNFIVKTKKHTAFNSIATDINHDGFTDLIVANDFDNPDYVYLNRNGRSFVATTDSFFKTTSFYSMGSDAADINNDGLIDFVTCDMRPANNYRSKTLRHETPYTWHYMLSSKKSFIENQMVRNTLQINNGNGTFSEIGEYAGIDATDWSWSPLLADFDNDGFKDLFITNGVWHPDVLEFDFIHKAEIGNTEKMLATMQADTLARDYFTNYLYQNNGNYTFADKRNEWGFGMPVDSRGAAYADLDNDGDLDLVVNNSNATSFIYRNDLNTQNNFIRFILKRENNMPAWHSSVTIYYNGNEKQYVELNPIRGFYSSSENILHFGIGGAITIDSAIVKWNNGRLQKIEKPIVNTLTVIEYNAEKTFLQPAIKNTDEWIDELNFIKPQPPKDNHVDFRIEPLLPNQYSHIDAPVAKADLNADGLEDVVVGGLHNYSATIYFQQKNKTYTTQTLWAADSIYTDAAILIIDIDNDGDNDIYIASGGYRYADGNSLLQHRLYTNSGNGVFEKSNNQPPVKVSSTCVVAADINADGIKEIFVGGRVKSQRYPETPESFLLHYEKGVWKNITNDVAPKLKNIGMVSSSVFTDFDNDSLTDLIIVGEYMRPEFFRNNGKGQLIHFTDSLKFNEQLYGFWNTITAADINEDGSIDFILGNLGENTRWKATPQYPLELYAADFDKNGSLDIISGYYENGKLYPVKPLNELKMRINGLSKKYYKHEFFGNATVANMFGEEALQQAIHLKAHQTASGILYNMGNNVFTFKKLPVKAQWAPVNSIEYNSSKKTLLLKGNFNYAEIERGKYTALKQLLLNTNELK